LNEASSRLIDREGGVLSQELAAELSPSIVSLASFDGDCTTICTLLLHLLYFIIMTEVLSLCRRKAPFSMHRHSCPK
jgi:hypothetical protein